MTSSANRKSAIGNRQSGFTLIELMVVVAIIALLAALLIPALQRARETSRATVCINNLRTLYLTSMLYADSYDDMFPDSFNPGVAVTYYLSWPSYLRHFLPGVKGSLSAYSLADTSLNPFDMSMEIRNVGKHAALGMNRNRPIYSNPFCCPSTTGPYDPTNLYGAAVPPGLWVDYALNAAAVGSPTWNSSFPKRKRSEHKAPHLLLLFADSAWANQPLNPFYLPSAAISPRHARGKRANAMLLDGHVESCRWPMLHPDSPASDIAYDWVSTPFHSASTGAGGWKAYIWP